MMWQMLSAPILTRLGILEGQYSYTTAAGLFTAVIGFAFTYAANKISNKLTGFGLW